MTIAILSSAVRRRRPPLSALACDQLGWVLDVVGWGGDAVGWCVVEGTFHDDTLFSDGTKWVE